MCGVVDLQEMERGKLWGGGEEKEIPDLQSLALSTSAEEPLSDSHLSPESHHDWRRRACVLGARVVINPPPPPFQAYLPTSGTKQSSRMAACCCLHMEL